MKKLALTIISLFVTGWAMAQTGNHWSPIGGTQYNMTVKGIIVIDGVTQANNQLEIGAFCGDECRGSRKAALFPPTGEYPVMLTVVSNVFSGETITFRIYDHATQQELNLTSESTLVFEHNTNQGSMGNWFPFIFNSSIQPQTYTLPITGYANSTGGYYLIAPPIDVVNPADIEGMTEGDFDLYYFDQSEELEWCNYKETPFNLESGKGYLYAHRTDVNLTFSGVPYNGDGKVPLAYTEGKPFAGWNLIGNPFDQVAYLADNRDFFVVNSYGDEIIPAITKDIQPMQGVFVVAANAMDSDVVFTTDMPASDDRAICLEISKDYSTVAIDRAIIRFGEGPMLPKIMLDEGNTEVYIPRGNVNYSVVRSNNEDEIPVNFKASEDGTYIVSVNTENVELDYLHLIDNLTGDDVDLLQNPSYRFEAQTNDYASRFKLVFVSNANGVVENHDSFAYYNSDAWVITNLGEALLQVIDLNGRLLSNQVLNGDARVSFNMNPGVYMLRLVSGDDIKVQKIIIQ